MVRSPSAFGVLLYPALRPIAGVAAPSGCDAGDESKGPPQR